jgi:glutathione S-transferase
MAKVDASVRALADGLGERTWFIGLHPSLADIAVGCALGYLDFRFPQIDWRTPHPNLARLVQKLAQRPSFAATLPPAPTPAA